MFFCVFVIRLTGSRVFARVGVSVLWTRVFSCALARSSQWKLVNPFYGNIFLFVCNSLTEACVFTFVGASVLWNKGSLCALVHILQNYSCKLPGATFEPGPENLLTLFLDVSWTIC